MPWRDRLRDGISYFGHTAQITNAQNTAIAMATTHPAQLI